MQENCLFWRGSFLIPLLTLKIEEHSHVQACHGDGGEFPCDVRTENGHIGGRVDPTALLQERHTTERLRTLPGRIDQMRSLV